MYKGRPNPKPKPKPNPNPNPYPYPYPYPYPNPNQLGRELDLYVTLEWHRNSKAQFYAAELLHMRMLDARFARYPNRCFDGSCNLTAGG